MVNTYKKDWQRKWPQKVYQLYTNKKTKKKESASEIILMRDNGHRTK